jgi:hypothetical protein
MTNIHIYFHYPFIEHFGRICQDPRKGGTQGFIFVSYYDNASSFSYIYLQFPLVV